MKYVVAKRFVWNWNGRWRDENLSIPLPKEEAEKFLSSLRERYRIFLSHYGHEDDGTLEYFLKEAAE